MLVGCTSEQLNDKLKHIINFKGLVKNQFQQGSTKAEVVRSPLQTGGRVDCGRKSAETKEEMI